jgi:hypothetical protein
MSSKSRDTSGESYSALRFGQGAVNVSFLCIRIMYMTMLACTPYKVLDLNNSMLVLRNICILNHIYILT